jgi:hypothetical protein
MGMSLGGGGKGRTTPAVNVPPAHPLRNPPRGLTAPVPPTRLAPLSAGSLRSLESNPWV